MATLAPLAPSGGLFVACETVERLDQRIDDCLAKRLCCLTDLCFVSIAGRGGEFGTLIPSGSHSTYRSPIAQNRSGCR